MRTAATPANSAARSSMAGPVRKHGREAGMMPPLGSQEPFHKEGPQDDEDQPGGIPHQPRARGFRILPQPVPSSRGSGQRRVTRTSGATLRPRSGPSGAGTGDHEGDGQPEQAADSIGRRWEDQMGVSETLRDQDTRVYPETGYSRTSISSSSTRASGGPSKVIRRLFITQPSRLGPSMAQPVRASTPRNSTVFHSPFLSPVA
jgi:hypothetical protein